MTDSVLDRTPPPADARVTYGDAPEQFIDIRIPEGTGPFPVIAFIHGGFWRAAYDLVHAGNICGGLTAAGFATWNIEYRRIGNDGGGWPGTFQDIATALRFVSDHAGEHGGDPTNLIVMGHSAGGHLALWAAGIGKIPPQSEIASEPVALRAAVSLAGVLDLRESYRLALSGNVVVQLLGGTPDEVPERYAAASPAELAPIGVKQVLIHGVDDDIVPIAISEGYAARATAAGDDVTLIEIPNAEHFAVIDPESRAFARILTAVSSLVERPAEARGARGPGGWSGMATRPGAVPTRPAI